MARRVLFSAVCWVVFQAPMFGTVYTTSTQTANWHLLVERSLSKSVVQLSDNCSGFVINEADDYVLTARHCGPDDVAKPVVVDLLPGRIVATDVHKDLLVVHVPGIDKPALRLATSDPRYGDVVASFGFGGGYERPMLRIARIANPKAIVPDAGPGEWVMVDSGFVGGQSGGAVVNEAGEVVLMVQMSNAYMGLGRSAEQIKDRVGKWFEKAKP
jgi:S1-C subfamily serine protease